jgi:hypothetical protein
MDGSMNHGEHGEEDEEKKEPQMNADERRLGVGGITDFSKSQYLR